MPTLRAAYKALRSDVKKRKRNEAITSEIKTRIKKIEGLIAENKKDEAKQYLKVMTSRYMSAASKGVVRKKTASRKISRLAKRINRIK
ncbi:MAG: 30S ribosomal protein S20 [Candidatus Omnitrophica bacterium]|nr:30S ribosomal protein S20 [Candidatus Omnitrophota bacterium]